MKEKNLTSYAKHLGYQGKTAVVVLNGLVISHKNQPWLEFCQRLREQFPAGAKTDLAAIKAA